MEREDIEFTDLQEKDVQSFIHITKDYLRAYRERDKEDSEGKWLYNQLKKDMPNKSDEELSKIKGEIIGSVDTYEKNKKDLNQCCDNGESKESWFARKTKEASVTMSAQNFGEQMSKLDQIIEVGNDQMCRTILTKEGEINQNRNLDGFLAEQEAVVDFNNKAVLNGSDYRAEVMVPDPGEGYGKNSFDAVIRDSEGKIIHQYQFKFGKDAKSTIDMIKRGNYNNQRLVVPKDQVEEVRKAFPNKSVDSCIGGTETVGIRSEDLTKDSVKGMQREAQEQGVIPVKTWNTFNTKELLLGVGKNVGIAALLGGGITAGFLIVRKALKGEKIEADETVKEALESGADAGVKTAISSGLKVALERGCFPFVTGPVLPLTTLTHIVCVGVDNTRTLIKIAKKEITLKEGMEQMARHSVAATTGVIGMAKGAAIGSGIGLMLGPVGGVVGGVVGGTVGYLAGSKVGETVCDTAKTMVKHVKETAKAVGNGVKKLLKGIKKGKKEALKK